MLRYKVVQSGLTVARFRFAIDASKWAFDLRESLKVHGIKQSVEVKS